jgi:MinD-like ATPase involved in chromosome partitioning or flagellar assembly
MIANHVHLYTWVDVEYLINNAQQQHDWPEELVWARTYWDGLALGIRPRTQQEIFSWLADKFAPHFSNAAVGSAKLSSSHILLESASGKSRQLEVFLEETDEIPRRSRYTPRLGRAPVLWPPHESKGYPAPLPCDLPPVVAFHSMNRDVERTLLSITLAKALHQQTAKGVLLIDGDIEAPRLTLLWRLMSQSISLADFLALVHSDPDESSTESIELVAERVKELFLDGLYLLPAFRLDKQFPPLDIKPWHFTQGAKDPFVLTTILARLGQLLDVQAVIVDLRSGLSELSAWLLLDPRVYRVLVTSQSGPAIEGTCYLLRLLAEAAPAKHKHEPLPALIVTTQTQEEALQARLEKQLLEAAQPLLAKKHLLGEGTDGPTDWHIQTAFLDAQFATLPNEWGEVTRLIEDSTLIEQMQPLVDWLAKEVTHQ